MTIMLMKKITLVTSFEEISISVLGISSKLRTHNLDFTWIPQLVAILTITITNYHYQCILAILTIALLDNNIHLEKCELLLSKGSDGAGDEGALGEPAIELGQEGLIPGHLFEFF